MTKIVALCGKKQSGKNTMCNFIHGHEMKLHDVIEHFDIKHDGLLEVNTIIFDESGKEHRDAGILDLEQKTELFYEYASRQIWPLIKAYSFADALKQLCVNLFDIPYECVYGTDDQKNQIQEHLLWENMPGVITESFIMSCTDWEYYTAHFSTSEPKDGPMTAREFMQFLGTDVMRKMYEPVWINAVLKQIEYDQPPIAVVTDCRFINEMKVMREKDALLIRLLRSPFESSHRSEKEVDEWKDYDCVIDNREMTIKESNDAFLDFLISKGLTKPIRIDTGKTISAR